MKGLETLGAYRGRSWPCLTAQPPHPHPRRAASLPWLALSWSTQPSSLPTPNPSSSYWTQVSPGTGTPGRARANSALTAVPASPPPGYFSDNILCHFCASMISGLVTTAASMPVDIVKTR